MSTTTVTTRTCDYCGIPILKGKRFVAAGAYGADFHAFCYENKMGALDLARLCGLDEVEYAKQCSENAIPDIIGRAWRGNFEPQITPDERYQLNQGTLE